MSATTTSDRFSDRGRDELQLEIVPPEGVPLVFTVARAGDRIAAFVMDAVRIAVALLLLWLAAAVLSFGGAADPWITALLLLALFLLRNGYFIWFELRLQGRTPGKRWAGLRVIDARGEPLTADAVVVRNLTREVELFVPVMVLADPELLVSSGPGWLRALSVLWLGVFLVFPLLNRERRRIGDLLGGTLVVRDRRRTLERDLGAGRPDAAEEVPFTEQQLAMYGVYELQVLEELLRDEPSRSSALDVVADKVRTKIGWSAPIEVSSRRFLESFYRAQRSRLERDLLLGQARERKRRGRLE